jgi:Transglutaminase-like superfamily
MTVTAARRVVLKPCRADLVDAGLLSVLCVVALIGFRTTYTGWGYLAVGIAGLVLGIAIGHVANALRQPMITVAALTVVVFFLAGGALTLRTQTGGALPTPGTLRGLADVGVHGWKEIVTTLPPVDGAGPLLVIPYILGLACGAAGLTMARRITAAAAPVVAPALVLAAVILLGTDQPAAASLQGVGFGAVSLCWIAVRGHRGRPPARTGSGRLIKLGIGAGVVLVAATGAVGIGSVLLGGGHQRVVLRSYVTPPFDIGAYPSPLVGFRKYTKNANLLWDQTLFRVAGLPSGQSVRIATLDDYDGSVWGATSDTLPSAPGTPLDAFQRVGPRIPATGTGAPVTVRITVAAAYADADDLSAWVPDAGSVDAVTFTGPNTAAHTDSFRYDLATAAGVVADRLRAGDSYVVHADLPSAAGLTADSQPAGEPALAAGSDAFVASRAVQWSDRAGSLGAQLLAVGRHLRDTGAYSDGGPGETRYLPGHGVGRLTSFLDAHQPVGDDEQYAAAFALMANELGMPTRVVLGALPEPDGTVRGRDVHAWVQVDTAGAGWVAVPRSVFMPDSSKKPDRTPPQEQQDNTAAVVPPPDPVHPPSSVDDPSQADPNAPRLPATAAHDGLHLPAFVVTALTWGGPPVLAVAALCGAVIGLKARRRHRRRTNGPAVTRMVTGWREVVDRARDLGVAVPLGRTRQEEARLLAAHPVVHLAAVADAGVFGPGDPAEPDVAAFWSGVDDVLRQMVAGLGRWQRFWVAVSPRSLLPRRVALGGGAR